MTVKTTSKSTGKSFDDFRASHDKSFIVPKKIKDGLEKLGESWEYEVEFIKRCSLSTTDLAAYRDQFSDFVITTNGKNQKRVWAGTVKFANKLREKIQ